MTDHSSITSVTEEDVSDESDTTETSSHSKASDGVSSILYSSECNTDDKLTPGLVKISISKHKDCPSKKRQRSYGENDVGNDGGPGETSTATFPYPYGCNPLSLQSKQKNSQPKKKQKRSLHFLSSIKAGHPKPNFLKKSQLPKQEEENFGVDDPDNFLFTDFSDTSSIPRHKNDRTDSCNEDDKSVESVEDDQRPYLPDMNSASWFQAKCFDHYWSHYNFVMEWYRQHLHAVYSLSRQFATETSQPHIPPCTSSQQVPKKRSKSKARSRNRARNRRLAKAKQRASQEKNKKNHDETSGTIPTQDSDEEESELEMEITEEMMDFFAKSFKHRMERDNKKESEDKDGGFTDGKVNFDKGLPGPLEQPGVRRTAEMKTLYGTGAPMIQGMETALQMTYDKILDRNQPKLWPNMPLKIVFA